MYCQLDQSTTSSCSLPLSTDYQPIRCLIFVMKYLTVTNSFHFIVVIADAINFCRVKIYPERLTMLIGNSVDFMCVVSGCGINHNISWIKASSTSYFPMHNHKLHIPTVQLNDSGNYYCIVIRDDPWMAQYNASGILQVTGM